MAKGKRGAAAKPQKKKKRFKLAKGQMVAINPQNKTTVEEVYLIYDRQSEKLGVQILRGPLEGYVFWVAKESYRQTIERGADVDVLKR